MVDQVHIKKKKKKKNGQSTCYNTASSKKKKKNNNNNNLECCKFIGWSTILYGRSTVSFSIKGPSIVSKVPLVDNAVIQRVEFDSMVHIMLQYLGFNI
jgi:hypothetical protein